MLNLLRIINAIPDHVGWIIVGVAGTLTAQMFLKLCGLFVEIIKERREAALEDSLDSLEEEE